MNIFIESITFKADWRCFKKGNAICFKPGLNIIVGEQGTGKSSLLHLITLQKENRNKIATLKIKATRFFHFDSEKMNPRTKGHVDNEMDVAFRFVSHGETLFPILNEIGRHRNSLILLDEPETALSIANTCRFIGALKKAERNGNQIIVSTHHPVIMNCEDAVLDMDTKQFAPAPKYIRSQASRSWRYFDFQSAHATKPESNRTDQTARDSTPQDHRGRGKKTKDTQQAHPRQHQPQTDKSSTQRRRKQ